MLKTYMNYAIMTVMAFIGLTVATLFATQVSVWMGSSALAVHNPLYIAATLTTIGLVSILVIKMWYGYVLQKTVF